MAMSIAGASLNLRFHSIPSLGFANNISNSNNLCFRFPKFGPQFAVTCSLPDATSSSQTTVELDRSLAVKKKAMDIQLRGTSIFLVGMNNSMKTSVGKLLAETLRYYYFDSDILVEEAAGGKSCVQALKESDEQALLESETEVLKQLSSLGRLVVCAGNGAVRTSTNLALLRYGISIWIDVPVEDEDEELKEGYATADATISLLKVASQLGCDYPTDVTAEDMTLELLKEIAKLTRVKKMMEEAATPF